MLLVLQPITLLIPGWFPLSSPDGFLSQEVFELRYARMPEEPPTPVKTPLGSKLKKIRGISSESSDESSAEDTDSSSSEESESESERANQLSYLQKQVRMLELLLSPL